MSEIEIPVRWNRKESIEYLKQVEVGFSLAFCFGNYGFEDDNGGVGFSKMVIST